MTININLYAKKGFFMSILKVGNNLLSSLNCLCLDFMIVQ